MNDEDNGNGGNPQSQSALSSGDTLVFQYDTFFRSQSSDGGFDFGGPDVRLGEQSGVFNVTLGTPVTIEGEQAFPLDVRSVFGPILVPRVSHIAIDGDGNVLASTDGTSLETLFDASSGTLVNGFFTGFAGAPLTVQPFAGNYNTLPALAVAVNESSNSNSVIVGQRAVSNSNSTITEIFSELGFPLGFRSSGVSFSSVVGVITSGESADAIELVDTNIQAILDAGFKPAPWAPINDAALVRSGGSSNVASAVYGSKVFFFGGERRVEALGEPTRFPFVREVDSYNLDTGAWTTEAMLPDGFNDIYSATTVGDSIVVMAERIEGSFPNLQFVAVPLIFDPSVGTFEERGPIIDGDATVNDTDLGDFTKAGGQVGDNRGAAAATVPGVGELVLFLDQTRIEGQAIYGYRPSDGRAFIFDVGGLQAFRASNPDNFAAANCPIAVAGNTVFVPVPVGDGSVSAFAQFDLSTETWDGTAVTTDNALNVFALSEGARGDFCAGDATSTTEAVYFMTKTGGVRFGEGGTSPDAFPRALADRNGGTFTIEVAAGYLHIFRGSTDRSFQDATRSERAALDDL